MKLFPAYYLLPIFLLPAALTSAISVPAVPNYSKPGCNDSCGNVRIPYPFGIGANCSVNKWYNVVCNLSKPYLSALNRSEILSVNLADQIVTVNTPKLISDCSQPMMSMDLGRSPFLFSKSHNKFVVEGCGGAVMMDQYGTMLTGCSTNCLNHTVSDKNNCQTTIPHYLKSYTVNLTRLQSRQGVGLASLISLIAITYTLYKVIRRAITKRQRKSVFKRINGGLLLKQQEEIDPSLVDKTILFTSRELAKATDNFNENRILGRGGQGTVYKGMLADGRIVAVKKSKLVDESQLEQFINEVVILSQVNHRNVVKLLGCCLETEVPLLVSEFIPNGTLYDRIHEDSEDLSFPLSMRLQIAIEVAQALAYLHSATSIPIYHRDIKTTNILLDNKYRAKVSDFGTSRFVYLDQTHLTTLIKGTLGYLDPEYFQSSQFTEKSDVYSFGVVIVELLTGERPISLTRFGENRSLVAHFILAMEEGRVISIFDVMVNKEGTRDELLELANLAMQCLNPIGRNRPTMKEVATKLEILRASHIPFIVQTNVGEVIHEDEISLLTSMESTSTYT